MHTACFHVAGVTCAVRRYRGRTRSLAVHMSPLKLSSPGHKLSSSLRRSHRNQLPLATPYVSSLAKSSRSRMKEMGSASPQEESDKAGQKSALMLRCSGRQKHC